MTFSKASCHTFQYEKIRCENIASVETNKRYLV